MAAQSIDPATVPVVTANGGLPIPALGLGTWRLSGKSCADLVARALELGYRHLDTAEMYGNEREVGEGLRASGLPREQVFVTTKAWHDHLDRQAMLDAARGSLDRLGIERADLYLIHWPSRETPLEEAIPALNAVAEAGLTRAIGVSNFPVAMVERSVELSERPIAVDQVEYHPALDQTRLLAALRGHGIALTAYSPLGRARDLDHPTIVEIAKKHGVTPAQVTLAWLIRQDGVIAIPRTSKPERLAENLASVDVRLAPDDVAAIDRIGSQAGRYVVPKHSPDWD